MQYMPPGFPQQQQFVPQQAYAPPGAMPQGMPPQGMPQQQFAPPQQPMQQQFVPQQQGFQPPMQQQYAQQPMQPQGFPQQPPQVGQMMQASPEAVFGGQDEAGEPFARDPSIPVGIFEVTVQDFLLHTSRKGIPATIIRVKIEEVEQGPQCVGSFCRLYQPMNVNPLTGQETGKDGSKSIAQRTVNAWLLSALGLRSAAEAGGQLKSVALALSRNASGLIGARMRVRAVPNAKGKRHPQTGELYNEYTWEPSKYNANATIQGVCSMQPVGPRAAYPQPLLPQTGITPAVAAPPWAQGQQPTMQPQFAAPYAAQPLPIQQPMQQQYAQPQMMAQQPPQQFASFAGNPFGQVPQAQQAQAYAPQQLPMQQPQQVMQQQPTQAGPPRPRFNAMTQQFVFPGDPVWQTLPDS